LRGSCTVLGGRGGEIPPRYSTGCQHKRGSGHDHRPLPDPCTAEVRGSGGLLPRGMPLSPGNPRDGLQERRRRQRDVAIRAHGVPPGTQRSGDGRTGAMAAGAVPRKTGGAQFRPGSSHPVHDQSLAAADPVSAGAGSAIGQYCLLCRARHSRDNAASRIMPHPWGATQCRRLLPGTEPFANAA